MNEMAQPTAKVDVERTVAFTTTQPGASAAGEPDHIPARRAGDGGLLGSESLENLDRMTNATMAKLMMGVSPVALAMSWFDWAGHLAASSITHGRSRRWTSGSAVTRDAGSISGASVGRMVSPGIGTKISPTTYDMLIKPDTQG